MCTCCDHNRYSLKHLAQKILEAVWKLHPTNITASESVLVVISSSLAVGTYLYYVIWSCIGSSILLKESTEEINKNALNFMKKALFVLEIQIFILPSSCLYSSQSWPLFIVLLSCKCKP